MAESGFEGTPSRGMARRQPYPSIEALRKLEQSLHMHARAPDACAQSSEPQTAKPQRASPAPAARRAGLSAGAGAWRWRSLRWQSWQLLHRRAWQFLQSREWGLRLLLWWPRLRKLTIVGGALGGIALLAVVALWVRLSSGQIELDVATPWLTAAIKDKFGPGHQVEVGGTQLERDANGRTALRIRDIVVRDAEGTIVASAPKAEVGLSSAGLLTGHIHAERLSLVGAEMAVRIEPDSKVTVFAGGNKRPFVTASASSTAVTGTTPPAPSERAPALAATVAPPMPSAPAAPPLPALGGVSNLAALVAWIESLDASGLDGRDLTEIGLKGGNLTVDDQRNGKQWTFTDIDLSVTRPKNGGIAVALGSEVGERPGALRGGVAARQTGHRVTDIAPAKGAA